MTTELRKIQTSKTGLYVTIPSLIVKELELKSGQFFKFTTTEDGRIVVEIIKMQ